eukprot:scaffold27324_cov63-Cyclotella_meneghiniana.AAC.4
MSAEKLLNWTAEVGHLSDDLAEWQEFIQSLIGVRGTTQVGGSQVSCHPNHCCCWTVLCPGVSVSNHAMHFACLGLGFMRTSCTL